MYHYADHSGRAVMYIHVTNNNLKLGYLNASVVTERRGSVLLALLAKTKIVAVLYEMTK